MRYDGASRKRLGWLRWQGMKSGDRFPGASEVDAHRIPVHYVIGGKRTSATQTTSMFAGTRRFAQAFRGPPTVNKSVAGCGRLKAASVPTGLIAGGAWEPDFSRESS